MDNLDIELIGMVTLIILLIIFFYCMAEREKYTLRSRLIDNLDDLCHRKYGSDYKILIYPPHYHLNIDRIYCIDYRSCEGNFTGLIDGQKPCNHTDDIKEIR